MHLTPNDQWDLFMYYLPHEQRTADELHISQSDPSLAHRAGRALMKLAGFRKRLLEYLKTSHPKSRKKGAPHKVRVLSQVNPDIDPKTMAKILIEIARECAREDRAS
ncbi:MAG: hypothetical protein JWP19_2015 [Rhodoglobus sp.]|nr:hypothetical protein [Rhodoglobus sp.]